MPNSKQLHSIGERRKNARHRILAVYTYAKANPLRLVDPDGNDSFKPMILGSSFQKRGRQVKKGGQLLGKGRDLPVLGKAVGLYADAFRGAGNTLESAGNALSFEAGPDTGGTILYGLGREGRIPTGEVRYSPNNGGVGASLEVGKGPEGDVRGFFKLTFSSE
jgi:hypothetical protein